MPPRDKRTRGSGDTPVRAAKLPSVTIVLSLYNEREVVAEKVQNFRDLHYPPEFLALAVGLDGCDDGTEEALSTVIDERIRVFAFPKRQGKTTVLNRIVAETSSEIVVFTDANAMFDTDAVLELVRPFQDSDVGLVSGRTIVTGSTADSALHNSYYDWLTRKKQRDSASGSVVGADGAIYAMRRSLIEPLSPEFINDLTHPIQTVLQNARAVFAPAAVAREPLEDWTFRGEFRRQVRMTAQAMHVVAHFVPALLRNHCYGYIARLVSTKVLRWYLPGAAVIAICGMGWLAAQGIVPAVAGLTVFFAGLAMALAGLWSSFVPLRGLAYLLVVGAAYTVGVYKWAVGERFVTWQPRMG